MSSANDEFSLTFAGGAGSVTGSKYLVRANGHQFLLDCGLFQGPRDLRLRNWAEPPFEPGSLDAVVLSHSHLDHTGYLPLLAKRGFRGPVYCTPGTADLLAVVLKDSAHLQEEDAARANRYGYTKHRPALPLYTTKDAEMALQLLKPKTYGERFSIDSSTHVLLRRAGHILGSATVEVHFEKPVSRRLVFSGDLGRWNRPILRDPEPVPEADVLLVESTYGDRTHAPNADDELVRIITETAGRGGAVIVPAFAIGRTQELIWTIRRLEDEGRLPFVAVYVDSPMAINVSDIYCRHPEDHDLDMKLLMDEKRCPLCCHQYNLVRTAEQSKTLNGQRGPMIIIAGSGMATGGRVLHHLKHRLPDHRNTVLLVGYQAIGTRGRLLHDGAKFVRIHGAEVPVRAHVETINGLSAHADQNEILRWLSEFKSAPTHTYVVHGEAAAARALSSSIVSKLGWSATVAEDGATVSLYGTPEQSGASR
ncbi:MAG: MBL fold metallo-hydrolase [Archangium gephyra]|uniref:MBL fold metallo-hydrolase n=1 Tax=Archangium gephyra TaxID=48 RepID=A0A2W5SS55_9BACT|nr:MAG: MBL fold metallo-hydrolase [Archangium gephyra]